MRWLVTGGRDFHDTQRVFDCLDHIAKVVGKPDYLVVGDARGADRSAKLWAEKRGVRGVMCKANWHNPDGTVRRAGGPERNVRMLDKLLRGWGHARPSSVVPLVIAFPGGKGTRDMTTRAHDSEVEVIEVPL